MDYKLKQNLTLGSLFSGSGGFELAGLLSGIKPVWASEVEPFPIRVTTKRMPFVEHLGEISQIDGGAIEPVDIITFGSPCQDLSIAGTKKGLTGNRSNLFYEAIRIIKEMREKTNGRYPKYIVWENVRGAFSSNKGNDFWKVLKEIAGIKGREADIPRPEKWANAGLIMGEDFSVGWRLFDSQHWGVPQRRKRIYLVADLAGGGAKKILFKSEGLSGYSAESFRAWQGAACHAEESTGEAGTLCLNDQGGMVVVALEGNGARPSHKGSGYSEEGVSFTLNATEQHAVLAPEHYCASKTSFFMDAQKEQANTLVATDYQDPPLINDWGGADYIVRRLTPTECARLQGFPDWWCSDLETENPTEEDIKFWTDVFETHRKVITKKKRPKTKNQIVKWLKNPRKDSAEYKMWGNGITLPIAVFVLSGIVWADSDDCKTG